MPDAKGVPVPVVWVSGSNGVILKSLDEGKTWTNAHNVADAPDGWYCYTAVYFTGPRVLLGFVSGGEGLARLSRTSIAWFDVNELYRKR